MESIFFILKWSGIIIAGIVFLGSLIGSIHILQPIQRGLITRLGKYNRFVTPGLTFTIPFIESLEKVNITEHMTEADKQEVITSDNLNASVDAQIYYKVKDEEESVKKSRYVVNNFEKQIIALARTTLRSIIGSMTMQECNKERGKINTSLLDTLKKEADTWGVDIVRAELKQIDPPKDVQESMNSIIKASNEKRAAIDLATSAENKADGMKRAAIKEAEGVAQARIIKAEAEAKSITLINEAAASSLKGNALILRKLETVEKALANNCKIIVPEGSPLTTLIGNLADIKE